MCAIRLSLVFFFNDTATTEIYTLSLHDALPISTRAPVMSGTRAGRPTFSSVGTSKAMPTATIAASTAHRIPARPCSVGSRSEEHTSELQSRLHLVCRLLLEKKKNSG